MPAATDFVLIRRALPADAAEITRVRIAAWKATYAGLVPASFLDAMSPSDPLAISRMAARVAPDAPTAGFVAELEGELVGFVTAGPEREHSRARPPRPISAADAEVYAIYLAPERRGSGIGAPLLAAALDWLRERDYRATVLWVLDANGSARRFYERHGWRETGRRQEMDLGGIVHEREYRIGL